MAKSHTHNKQKKSRISRKMLAVIAVVFVVFGALAIYFGIAWYQGFRFEQTETKVNQLADAFVAELGEPADRTSNQSCGYASAKYKKGSLGCGFNIVLTYKIDNEKYIKQYIDTLQTVIKQRSDLVTTTYEKTPSENLSGSIQESVTPPSNTFYVNKYSTCSNTYTPLSQESYYEFFGKKTSSDVILKVSLGCGTHPLRPFYPVSD